MAEETFLLVLGSNELELQILLLPSSTGVPSSIFIMERIVETFDEGRRRCLLVVVRFPFSVRGSYSLKVEGDEIKSSGDEDEDEDEDGNEEPLISSIWSIESIVGR